MVCFKGQPDIIVFHCKLPSDITCHGKSSESGVI